MSGEWGAPPRCRAVNKVTQVRFNFLIEGREVTREEFPVAEVQTTRGKSGWPVLSRMWIATGLCVLTALGLTWYSLEPAGTEIVLHFQEGHGLSAGDPLRHRGIEIGKVIDVELNEQLSGIKVRAELTPAAKGLAREGTRFWIVRPTVDASGISGLETALGPKYIAVAAGPAESGEPRFEFTGTEAAPADGLYASGLELVLRGPQRSGIIPGAPLTWRGIEVGRVLSCGLSPDATHVDVQVRIDANYQRLINSATQFWVLSGVKLDAGLSGLKLSADSLATVVRGGIGLITPKSAEAKPVQTGDVFTLHPEAEESWTEEAAPINLLELNPPPTLPLVASWQQKTLGFTRTRQRRSLGVPITTGNQSQLIVPASLLEIPAGGIEGSLTLATEPAEGQTASGPLQIPAQPGAGELLVKLPVSGTLSASFPESRLRAPTELEDCFATRQTIGGETLLESIGKHELSLSPGRWIVSKPSLNTAIWQGAAVLSARDGQLIGILIVEESGPCIAPIK
jgi:hypothetical protein